MGHFLCGVERVKRLVKVHLHCIVSNLKIISKMSRLPPPGKISADAHAYVVRFSASFEKQVRVFSSHSLKGRNDTLNLVGTNTRSPGQVVYSSASEIICHTQSLHA